MKTQTILFMALLIVTMSACGGESPVAPEAPIIGTTIEFHSTSRDFDAVWGFGANDVFAVGEDGLFHYDGQTWELVDGSLCGLRAIWGPSRNDLWAIDFNNVYRFDGRKWTDAGLPEGLTIFDIWGASSSSVFAVGPNGGIHHFDGSQWTTMSVPTQETLLAVWGTSASNVFAVGSNAAIVHFNGTEWINESWEDVSLRDVRGTGPNDVYAVGKTVNDEPAVLHYDGSAWEWVPAGSTGQYALFSSVWPTADGIYFAALNNVLKLQAFGWQTVGWSEETLRSLWGNGGGDVFCVGRHGYAASYDGATWATLSHGQDIRVRSVWQAGSNDFFVADHGSVYRWDGSDSWTEEAGADIYGVFDVWGISPQNIVAVGAEPAATSGVLRYDGSSWSQDIAPDVGPLYGVWGTPNNLFAVASFGRILHNDGAQWAEMRSPTTETLRAIWGREPNAAFAVGDRGTIIRYDGSEWTEVRSNVTSTLLDVAGRAADNVYAVGHNGTIVHYDGKEWQPMPSGTNETLRHVWASPDQQILAGGDDGTLLHLDGGEWRPLPSIGCEAIIDCIAGTGTSDFRVFTRDGARYGGSIR